MSPSEFLKIWDNIFYSLQELSLLALLFFLLAILVKGKQAFKDIYNVWPNSSFNLAIMLLNGILLPPFISFIATYLTAVKPPMLVMNFWDASPSLLVILAAVFAGDFIGYWRHRLEHCRWLWPSHSIHHSDDKMSWLTLERFHPINRITTYIVDTYFLILLGFPPYAVIVNNMIRHFYGYLIHADLPWTYGWWGKVFVSPVMHQWHHADVPKAYNTNFATVFSFFDRLFGTYWVPSLCNVKLGVARVSKLNLIRQLVYPFKRASYIGIPEAVTRKVNPET